MSNLILPFAKSGPGATLSSSDENAFSISLTDGGCTAIAVQSFGTDPSGDSAVGLYAESDGVAVQGMAISTPSSGTPIGVLGGSDAEQGYGVLGTQGATTLSSDRPAGVVGSSNANYGVFGISNTFDGVKGVSAAAQHAGVSAVNTAPATSQQPSGYGVWASSNNTGIYARGAPAGYFQGDVLVTGDVVLVNQSGDVAEDFDVDADPLSIEPGTVLVIQEDGSLRACTTEYDSCVAGVVAGAGDLKPAVVLQRIPSASPRSPLALIGKVFCKVDASFGAITAGDLLTTSRTPGHAMKASDRTRAPGTVIGKALGGLGSGVGFIPMLVSPR